MGTSKNKNTSPTLLRGQGNPSGLVWCSLRPARIGGSSSIVSSLGSLEAPPECLCDQFQLLTHCTHNEQMHSVLHDGKSWRMLTLLSKYQHQLVLKL